jgi:hypothetical protein
LSKIFEESSEKSLLSVVEITGFSEISMQDAKYRLFLVDPWRV